jgi:hypothetical protein
LSNDAVEARRIGCVPDTFVERVGLDRASSGGDNIGVFCKGPGHYRCDGVRAYGFRVELHLLQFIDCGLGCIADADDVHFGVHYRMKRLVVEPD